MIINYRIHGSGPGYDVLADEDTPAATLDKISAYKPSLRATPQVEPLASNVGGIFSTFVQARAGRVNVSFSVDRQHGSVLAALQFLQTHLTAFAVASNFDLQITIGQTSVYIPNCAVTQIEPDEHSDQHTFVRYTFTGSTYTNSDPG